MSELSVKRIQVPLHTFECASECQLVEHQKQEYQKARFNAMRARMAEMEMEYRTREVIDGALYLLQKPLNVMTAMSNNLERQACGVKVADCMPFGCALDEALESGHAAVDTLRLSLPNATATIHGPVNVNEAIRDCLVLSADRIAASGIDVDWRAQPDLPMIYGDEISLRILLRSIIENAIIAVGQKGARGRDLRIDSQPGEEGMIEVFIKDSGPGIERTQRSRIFEPFFTHWDHGPHRAGMGLAIARQISVDLRGDIEIGREGSLGTTVRISLPAC